MSRSIGQEFSIKKNSFSIVAANTTLLSRVPVTGYTFGDPTSNYYSEDFKIYNQTMWVNPKLGLGYSRRLWKKMNAKHLSTSYFVFTCDLTYSKLDYKREKVGTFGGGLRQYYFEGTVKEQFTSQFLSLGLGAKYYFTSFRGEIFGIAIGIERNKIIASSGKQTYFNKLDNQTWTNSSGAVPHQQMPLKQRIKTNLTWPQDYFSCNLTLSAGKNVGKSCHAGFYLQYSASEYLF